MFKIDQKEFSDETEDIGRNNNLIPDAEESRDLWNEIWRKSVCVLHNENAESLRELERDLNNVEKQDNVKVWMSEKVSNTVNSL